jgi:lipoate-protein ligase A
MSELQLLIDAPAPGAENMRRDTRLLERCAAAEINGAVRIYSFSPPCLSLGRMQRDDDVDLVACARDGVAVVHRPSGGRAVLHDREVTYAVVCKASDPDFGGRVLQSCARIHAAVAAGLRRLGIETWARSEAREERAAARARAMVPDCFAHPSVHELVDRRGRKLVGSAQARHRGAMLQHGSVLIEQHRARGYLRGLAAEAPSSSVNELAGREISREQLVEALVAGFEEIVGPRLAQAVFEAPSTTA